MTEMREKMIKAMELRNFSPNTQTAYLAAVTNLAKHYMKSPQEISQVEVEDYLLYLKKERKLSYSTRNQAISGLKFFYNETLKNPDMVLQLPRKKTPVKLPEVLSIDEVKRVINAPSNIRHRMILMGFFKHPLILHHNHVHNPVPRAASPPPPTVPREWQAANKRGQDAEDVSSRGRTLRSW